MSISLRISAIVAAAFCAALPSPVAAQATATPSPFGAKPLSGAATPSALGGGSAKPGALSTGDAKFIKDASESILFEQKLADLAEKTASNDAVKKAATTMNGELKKVWEQLATLSTSKSAKMALEAKKTETSKTDSLAKMKPDKFDKEWVKEAAKETKKTSHLFETAEKSAQDPDVKKFLSDWTPTIRGQDSGIVAAERDLTKKK